MNTGVKPAKTNNLAVRAYEQLPQTKALAVATPNTNNLGVRVTLGSQP